LLTNNFIMARAMNLSFEGKSFSLGIQKVNRSKIYGYTSVDVRDDDDLKCELATISDDGKYILSKGCVGYTSLNEKGEYVSTFEAKVVDSEGNLLEKIPSSFDIEKINLQKGNFDDFLQLNVKSVYEMIADGETDMSDLVLLLKEHKLLTFNFNYRTDYDSDEAFLLESNESVFMVIGSISPFEFIGLEKTVEVEIEEEDDEDDFDFGML